MSDYTAVVKSTPRIIKARENRNPILAEKTPRTVYQSKKWNYDIPKGPEEKRRWVEPIKEDSIISMFDSVKDKVAAERLREEAYEARMKEFERKQSLPQEPQVSTRSTSRSSHPCDSTRIGSGRTARTETNRTGREDYEQQSGRMPSVREKSLSDFPVGALMTMQKERPEVLAKRRAERAAKFVQSLKHPLDPPDHQSMSSRVPFRPGGTSTLLPTSDTKPKGNGGGKYKTKTATTATGIAVSARDVDTARMKESLKSLVDALENTEQEIARQDLKIALSKKVKTYEKKGSKV
mmetsp:Transcript_12267/g.18589  ORF Transcript_12267/g.18589 Transcript_12267/m.18589 type:complete len:293 (-) Transcript_12267:166-1044(-)|eukprot:CAMPEP_0185023396 /NCGR_PEP_ID=MMETSP1103-20130426/6070_1 /TAXON_ID=36769 /ORGANISM="Paraphysomonas bandaiensis, Strain Caron Lab Isolate" /LENGTH=292 /DNA_ID=CAMNT_0027555971 /DNA_START=156 /DNA_END=1034 /DNA_ORIENTATION=+